ncbi:MAG: hypothetical protein HYX27_18700 [Acidobacteria bacterium]|nr:hypothetical protein [Acidobacteriota bacterium]
MLVLRVARLTTTWTKTGHRDPRRREPIFQPGDKVIAQPSTQARADLLLIEETPAAQPVLHELQFHPPGIERRWAIFGLQLTGDDSIELWLRTARDFFYGVPRRAEYRLAILRPGEVTRVLHNAKNDFSAASGRERTYRWNDFVFEHLGRADDLESSEHRLVPIGNARLIDLRANLL